MASHKQRWEQKISRAIFKGCYQDDILVSLPIWTQPNMERSNRMEWISNSQFLGHENHLEGLGKHRLLGSTSEFLLQNFSFRLLWLWPFGLEKSLTVSELPGYAERCSLPSSRNVLLPSSLGAVGGWAGALGTRQTSRSQWGREIQGGGAAG